MESIGNARSFLSAAREVALRKPIIVIKVGRTEAAAKAVMSHTGTLTGNDEVLDAAFRRVGVLRVDTIQDLFDMAEVLGKQPRPKGCRLAVITNAGGPGVLATDMLVREGGKIAQLSEPSFQKLNALLPKYWSRNNPVDVLGDATTDQFVKTVEIVSADTDNDGILVIVTPQGMTDPTSIAKGLEPFRKLAGKPILASWMGASAVADGEAILNAAGIPTFEYPDTAARAFCSMWRYNDNLRMLYETPALKGGDAHDQARAKATIKAAVNANRTLLTEVESKQILRAYGIPTVETHVATSEEETIRIAAKLGRVVVLKLYSDTVTHKTDVGGVKLGLQSEKAIREAYREIQDSVRKNPGAFLGVTVEPMIDLDGYELILGSSTDAQFGPVLLFGSGGELVEVRKDYVLGLPPLNATLARRMMEQTRVYTALKGVRGRTAVDLAQLEALLVRFSLLVAQQRRIKEIEVNPLLVSPTRTLALDARVVLHDPTVPEKDLPFLAIRPYPEQYVSIWELRNGVSITIRPIRPEDEPLMIKFHGSLSEDSVYSRYFGFLKLEQRTTHERLTRICFNDYDREMAMVGIRRSSESQAEQIIGIGRLIKVHGANEAEFAIVVTPLGAIAKFASAGKRIPKKDLGLISMTYGNIYVACVAMGAKDEHTVKAFLEAEAYDGPALIIAYSHCIAHGINMTSAMQNQKAAVLSGQWLLYRYNPDLAARGENPLHLDSAAPKLPVADYLNLENRFKMLSQSRPEEANLLFKQAQQNVDARWQQYHRLAENGPKEKEKVAS
jgi:acetyltransferase